VFVREVSTVAQPVKGASVGERQRAGVNLLSQPELGSDCLNCIFKIITIIFLPAEIWWSSFSVTATALH